jgi:hypothetical protein
LLPISASTRRPNRAKVSTAEKLLLLPQLILSTPNDATALFVSLVTATTENSNFPLQLFYWMICGSRD